MDGTVAANLIVHVGADIADAMGGLDQVDQRVQSSGANFGAASRVMAVGAGGILAGLTAATKAAGGFESIMNVVGVVSGATGTAFDALSNKALQIGKDTVFGALEGAQAIAELSKAGVGVQDILNGAAMGAANLAAAGGIEIPRAATLISNAMNMYRLSGEQATAVADVFAAAANKSAADVSDLALAMSQVGPGAANLGLSLEDTVAALALFSDYGLRSSDAGTSLKQMLASLTPTAKKTQDLMRRLGFSAFDAQGNFVGMEEVARRLYNSLKDLTVEQRDAALGQIFGSDASRAAAIIFRSQEAAVSGTGDAFEDYRAAVEASGQATDVANARMAGMNGAIEELRGTIETAMILVGRHFTGAVEAAADAASGAVDWFINLDAGVQGLIANGALVAAAVLGIGAALGTVVAVGAPIVAALSAIAGPIAILVAAGGALFAAWQTNFLGIRDLVQTTFGGVMGFLGGLAETFLNLQRNSDISPFRTALAALLIELRQHFGSDNPVVEFVAGVVAAVRTLSGILSTAGGYFRSLKDQGINPVTAGLQTLEALLTTAFGADNPIVRFFNAAKNALLNVRNYIVLLVSEGDYLNHWLTRLPDGIQPVVRWFGALVSMVQNVVQGFREGGLQGAIAEFLGFIPTLIGEAAQYAGSMLDLGRQLVGWVWNGIKENAPKVWDWFTTDFLPGIADALGGIMDSAGPKIDYAFTLLKADLQAKWIMKIGPFFDELPGNVASALSNGWDAITKAASTLFDHIRVGAQMAWAKIGPWLRDTALPAIGTALSGAWETVKTAGSDLMGKVGEGVKAYFPSIASWLSTDPAGLPGIVSAITEKAAEFVGAGMSILGGLLRGIVENREYIGSTLKDHVIPLIVGAFAAAPILLLLAGQGIVRGLLSGMQHIWNNQLGPWIKGVVGGIPGALGALLELLKPKGMEIILGVLRGMQDSWNNIVAPWLKAVFPGIAKIEGFVTAASELLSNGRMLITNLLTGFQEIWNNRLAPWLKTVLAGLANPDFFTTAVTGMLGQGRELVANLLSGLQDVWNNNLSPWLKTVLSGLANPEFFTEALTGFIGKGREVVSSLLTGFQDIWNNTLAPWLKGVLGGLANPEFFTTAITGFLSKGKEAIGGLLWGLQDIWNNNLAPWLKTVLAGLPGLLTDAGTWLVDGGRAIIDGLRHGVVDFWNNTFAPWFGGVKATITGWFGGAYEWLKESGRTVMDGLRHGVQDYWNNTLWPFITGIDDTIIGFFANAGTWLVDAGKAIIQGLIDGIGQKFEDLGTALGDVGTFIQDNKGPIEKDRRLLIPAGLAIMDGLSGAILAGAERSLGPALRTVTGLIGQAARQPAAFPLLLGSAPSAAPGMGGPLPAGVAGAPAMGFGTVPATRGMGSTAAPQPTVIHQTNHITLDLRNVEEMVEAGKFVRDLGPTRTLYLGVT